MSRLTLRDRYFGYWFLYSTPSLIGIWHSLLPLKLNAYSQKGHVLWMHMGSVFLLGKSDVALSEAK